MSIVGYQDGKMSKPEGGPLNAEMQEPCQDGIAKSEHTSRDALRSQLMRKGCQEHKGMAQKPSSGDGGCELPISLRCLGEQCLRGMLWAQDALTQMCCKGNKCAVY